MKNILFIASILILSGCMGNNTVSNDDDLSVQSFQECVAAGNPVMESYPRQCRHGDITYTEIIDDTPMFLEKACNNTSDCMLPMSYAVRSNCPYSTACIDGYCAVICPVWEHSPNPEERISYQVECKENSECDCSSWDTEGNYPCECIDGSCVSVVEKK